MTSRALLTVLLAAAAVAAVLAVFEWSRGIDGSIVPRDATPPPAQKSAADLLAPSGGCLPTGDGFFRARLDGELQMRLDWGDAQIQCEGMARPDGNGVRLSFRRARPQADSLPDSLLIVLGISGLSESSSGQALPANVTIIEERTSRVFGTLGDDKCTVDELRQELVSPWRPDTRVYRVSGRGFCTAPALAVGGDRTVLMSTFDFAGQVMYETIGAPHRGRGSA